MFIFILDVKSTRVKVVWHATLLQSAQNINYLCSMYQAYHLMQKKPRLIKNTGLHQIDGYWSSQNTIATKIIKSGKTAPEFRNKTDNIILLQRRYLK